MLAFGVGKAVSSFRVPNWERVPFPVAMVLPARIQCYHFCPGRVPLRVFSQLEMPTSFISHQDLGTANCSSHKRKCHQGPGNAPCCLPTPRAYILLWRKRETALKVGAILLSLCKPIVHKSSSQYVRRQQVTVTDLFLKRG